MAHNDVNCNHAFFETILNAAPVGLAFLDRDLRFVHINAALASMNGLPAEAHIGRTAGELYQPAAELWEPLWRKVLATGVPLVDVEVRGPIDGQGQQALASYYPVRAADGAILGLGMLVQDVSEHRQVDGQQQQRLLEREQAARVRVELVAQRMGRLQQITAAFAEALTAQQVGEVFLRHVIPAVGAIAGGISLLSDDGAWLEPLCTAGAADECEERFRRTPIAAPTPFAEAVRGLSPLWIASQAELAARYPHLVSLAGPHAGGLANLPLVVNRRAIGALALQYERARSFPADERDFTLALTQQCAQALERAGLYEANERARATAESAVAMRDAFLSLAAHELRNPLTSLAGQAFLLQRRLHSADDERNQRTIDLVVGQVDRLTHLIDDLLDASRIEQGQLTIAHEPLDLGGLLRRIADELSPTLSRHSLHVAVDCAPLPVLGDALRLEQVFVNLLQNAVKYSPGGGAITISAARAAAEVRVAVRDEGMGIPAAALPQLFGRFFRAANASKARLSGLGVGLYVVREIVTLHGGTVSAESAEGKGSTFTVALPLHEA
jgi:PAS domain S-box-containing protein